MRFLDRREAGERLARVLANYLEERVDGVVCALPRGGVAVGAPVARHLGLPLRVILVRKVGAPGNPEAAVCAVGEGDVVVCDEEAKGRTPPEWLTNAIELAQHELQERFRRFGVWVLPEREPPSVAVIADDGAATGLTVLAAIEALRQKGVPRIIVGLPVAPTEVGHILRSRADEVVILHEDPDFLGAVGAYYDHFDQLSDEEALALLESANTGR